MSHKLLAKKVSVSVKNIRRKQVSDIQNLLRKNSSRVAISDINYSTNLYPTPFTV